jgi:hypothetical protein
MFLCFALALSLGMEPQSTAVEAPRSEAQFRSILHDHPADIDAQIGLANALLRRNAWAEALEILQRAAPGAGDNADLFGALGRAYRRAGDDRLALAYFARAKTLAPGDADVVAGYEATAFAYGHSVLFDGFSEPASADHALSGTLAVSWRATPRLHVEAAARAQRRARASDALAGGGIRVRAGRATIAGAQVLGASGNESLPNLDASGNVVHYAGAFELGVNVRALSFAAVDVAAASPLFAWDTGGRWRLDARYTYSRSRFAAAGQSSGDHSILLRQTVRGWRRVWLNGSYAYGIESFEQLTADRIGSLGTSTVNGGVKLLLPSLTAVNAGWEHQWRSDKTTVDRVTFSILQAFR